MYVICSKYHTPWLQCLCVLKTTIFHQDPEEPEAWSGVRDALKEGNDCIQFHLFKNGLVGSEDCLYLNVYTPQVISN